MRESDEEKKRKKEKHRRGGFSLRSTDDHEPRPRTGPR
jgi:hypothetical protein